MDATDQAINYLAIKGYQPEFGARPVKRVIQKELLNPLAKLMISGEVTGHKVVVVQADDLGIRILS